MATTQDEANAQQASAAPAPAPAVEETAPGPQIVWQDGEMKTLFANVVNASSTMEEFMLFFGTNETWNPVAGGDIRVKLEQRVILSPYAAKRLSILLSSVLTEYERRFGPLNVEGRLRPPGAVPEPG